jgi:hypothetical protein
MTRTAFISTARIAGLVYLVVVLSGIVSLAYVPSKLTVWSDAAQTVRNITESQELFRAGIAAGFVCYIAFLVLPLLLFRLLGHVDRNAAMLMVILAVVSVPISLLNMAHRLDVLTLLAGKPYLASYPAEQLNATVMLSLASYGSGILVAKIFWGLWLLPLGYLVLRSGMIPRVLGVFLVLGCFGYLVDVFGRTLVADYASSAIAGYATLPASLGEIGTCLWLLVFGARSQPEVGG